MNSVIDIEAQIDIDKLSTIDAMLLLREYNAVDNEDENTLDLKLAVDMEIYDKEEYEINELSAYPQKGSPSIVLPARFIDSLSSTSLEFINRLVDEINEYG